MSAPRVIVRELATDVGVVSQQTEVRRTEIETATRIRPVAGRVLLTLDIAGARSATGDYSPDVAEHLAALLLAAAATARADAEAAATDDALFAAAMAAGRRQEFTGLAGREIVSRLRAEQAVHARLALDALGEDVQHVADTAAGAQPGGRDGVWPVDGRIPVVALDRDAQQKPQRRHVVVERGDPFAVCHSNLSVVLQSGDDGESPGGATPRPATSSACAHVRAAEDCQ